MYIVEHEAYSIDEILKNREIISAVSCVEHRKIGERTYANRCGALVLTLKPLNDGEEPDRVTIIPSPEYGLTFFADKEMTCR